LRLTSPLNLPAPGRRQWLYGDSSSWQPPVFLLNSRLGRFSAAGFSSSPHGTRTYHRHPFSRSYGVMLPSSFSTDHSSTLGFSPRLPVSVCGTVSHGISTRGFSGRPASRALGRVQALCARRPVSALGESFRPLPVYAVASGHPAPDGSSASASPLVINTLRPAREYSPVSHRLRLSPST
jgi:hypothetical protein